VELGGFDPVFRRAGDDVDLCWRVTQNGWKIGFCPPAFVWHYRRSTVRDYLRQQEGYGEAEALLVRKHPENFNALGSGIWRGRIYGSSQLGLLLQKPIIYRGLFASAGFQFLYNSPPAETLMLSTMLEYHLLVTVPLWVLSALFHPVLPLAVASLLLSFAVCVAAAVQVKIPKSKTRWWSRPLVALLFFLQPIVRGWARYRGRILLKPAPLAAQQTLDSIALRDSRQTLDQRQYWSRSPIDRIAFVRRMLAELDRQGWMNKTDVGWSDFDVEIYGSRWANVQLTTATESHPQKRQLLRCRVQPRWSLQAKTVLALLLGTELLLVEWWAKSSWWLCLLLVTLPAFVWFVRRQQRTLQSMLAVFLDELAEKFGFSRQMVEPVPTPTSQSASGRAIYPGNPSPAPQSMPAKPEPEKAVP
jgi:O-antigen biosynthesis protein